MHRVLVGLSLCLVAAGCAPAASPPASPEAPSPSGAVSAPAAAPSPRGLPAAPRGVPRAPARCQSFRDGFARDVGTCPADGEARLAAVDAALAKDDQQARDDALRDLEPCGYEPGLIRALRAELAPPECGDEVVAGVLEGDSEPASAMRDALVGLGLSARLSRLVRAAPELERPYDKARFMEFFKGELTGWIAEQAHAIHQIALGGAKLRGYAKGIVAVEAGLADMRFVEAARSIPLPEEMERDEEVKNAYYGALDEALEPRKARGRDAALVGLRKLAELGVIEDARVDRARELLSRLFGGRRIDALDGLLLPSLDPVESSSVVARLAERLPTFYAERLLGEVDPTSPDVLRALLERGIPPSIQRKLEGGGLPTESVRLFAHALIRLGQRYWRAADFAAAARVARGAAGGKAADAESRLLAALGDVLSKGPKDAAEMMLRGPQYPAGIGTVAPLDEMARSKGPMSGLAEFDAAYILRLVPPLKAKPEFFEELALRFDRARKKLADRDAKTRARDAAQAARDTAKAIHDSAASGDAPPPSG